MGKRPTFFPANFSAKDQSNIRQFIYKLFEENCSPEEALASLKNKFDPQDYDRVRELWSKMASSDAMHARGPRTKN